MENNGGKLGDIKGAKIIQAFKDEPTIEALVFKKGSGLQVSKEGTKATLFKDRTKTTLFKEGTKATLTNGRHYPRKREGELSKISVGIYRNRMENRVGIPTI